MKNVLQPWDLAPRFVLDAIAQMLLTNTRQVRVNSNRYNRL